MITAAKINKIVTTGGVHPLYHRDGTWYNHLKDFPGVLFDINGFVVIKSKTDYSKSPYLGHGKELNVTGGISSIPGYQKFTEDEKKKILEMI